MGYTHYWEAKKWDEKDQKGYEKALPLIEKLLDHRKDLIQFEMDDSRPPQCDSECIHFNGPDEYGYETFLVCPGVNDSFCKTNHKPYDLVVCEVLLILNAFIPNFKISSDGFSAKLSDPVPEGNWPRALERIKKFFGITYRQEVHPRKPYCDIELILEESA